jgi:membrane associated rhomboid family serine protease
MRYPASSPRTVVYQFGPGPITLAVKLLIWSNVAMFVLSWLVPDIVRYLGLQPAAVFYRLFVWQPVTYMFLHAGALHILFNMLALWMFGVELERRWGPRFFLRYYGVTGVGAAVTTLALALLPWGVGAAIWNATTVGASGAIYGLLLAYALYFPDRPIYVLALFPVPAKYAVMIFGAIELMLTLGGGQGGVANGAHLGGLVVGYVYLRMWPSHPMDAIKYRYVRFRMNRLRRKFDVHAGGRGDWDRRVH